MTPNHVMIPATNGGNCPEGPPAPAPATWAQPPAGTPGVEITIIDAGYIWDASWPQNPLTGLATLDPDPPHQADWLSPAGWAPQPADTPDADLDGLLDPLAGHANFVAGVLAQGCNEPQLHIWNHNGGFCWDVLPIPILESNVLRSIAMSQDPGSGGTPTQLIQVGFSFAAYPGPSVAPTLGHAVTWVPVTVGWTMALKFIPAGGLMIVPAGNQGFPSARFPASLYNPAKPRVIGVAALDTAGNRPPWSNWGGWVACSTIGENIVAPFLHVTGLPPEEDPTSPDDYAAHDSAVWNGTSFAAPKVTAALANRLATAGTAVNAWASLIQGASHSGALGYLLPALPPI